MTIMEMKRKTETWYISLEATKAYWQYDRETETARCGGKAVHISRRRFEDFFGTARELGIKAGVI